MGYNFTASSFQKAVIQFKEVCEALEEDFVSVGRVFGWIPSFAGMTTIRISVHQIVGILSTKRNAVPLLAHPAPAPAVLPPAAVPPADNRGCKQ